MQGPKSSVTYKHVDQSPEEPSWAGFWRAPVLAHLQKASMLMTWPPPTACMAGPLPVLLGY